MPRHRKMHISNWTEIWFFVHCEDWIYNLQTKTIFSATNSSARFSTRHRDCPKKKHRCRRQGGPGQMVTRQPWTVQTGNKLRYTFGLTYAYDWSTEVTHNIFCVQWYDMRLLMTDIPSWPSNTAVSHIWRPQQYTTWAWNTFPVMMLWSSEYKCS